MSGVGGTALSKLQAAVREFQAREERRVDIKGLRAGIDALKDELATYSSPHVERAGDIEAEE